MNAVQRRIVSQHVHLLTDWTAGDLEILWGNRRYRDMTTIEADGKLVLELHNSALVVAAVCCTDYLSASL